MSEYVTSTVKGLDELQSKLEELPQKVAKRGLRGALKAGANIFKNAFVANAPKDSGFLSEHFDVKTRMRSDSLAGSAFIGPNSRALYPNRKSSWAGRTALLVMRWLEFGTSERPKNPVMTSGFESHKQEALDAVIVELKDALEV